MSVPLPPAELAAAQQARQARLSRSVVDRAAERWRLVDAAAITPSWAEQLPSLVRIVTAGQVLAATAAEEYVTAAAGEGPGLAVTAFAGRATDGRSLAGLLALPVVTTKTAIAAGQPATDALGRGLAQLLMSVQTEVADAGRLATGVAVTARPRVVGYVRVVSLPACDRCVLLAGRVYRWSQGFQRHPRCDCGLAPAGSGEADMAPDPKDLFGRMNRAEQDASFGRAGAQAVRGGADISQVVNAKRGMYEAGGRQFTSEGTTRRGLAGKQLEASGATVRRDEGERYRRVNVPRLTPTQIYHEAAGDRGEAVRLLKRFGYIT